MRVLLISGEYPPMEGGVADFTHLLSASLTELGAEVHVLTSVQASQAPNSQVRRYPLMCDWSWRALYDAVHCLCDKIHPDVLNIQYQAAAYNLHPAINLFPLLNRRLPVATTFHDLLVPYLFPKAGPLRWRANLALARSSAAVIVTNAEDRAKLARYGWMRRLEMIPIGSNIAPSLPLGYNRAAWRRRWQLGDEALLLCYFGFLNASKGGEELIAALDHLVKAGRDAHLVMMGGAVGASDPTNRVYLEQVQGAIRKRGLERRVIWTGYMPPEDVSACFGAADICVLPYRDGISFRRGSLMAALVHGMPIISTRPQVALPELCHGENVWLAPSRAPDALAAAIAHLADNPTLRQRLGAGARALSREFDWARIAARTLEVYHAIAARHPSGAGAARSP